MGSKITETFQKLYQKVLDFLIIRLQSEISIILLQLANGFHKAMD